MSHSEIIAAITNQIGEKNGLQQMSKELEAALLSANNYGALTLTAQNENYFSLQGKISTNIELIKNASHFEHFGDTIMMKQGAKKMRAFKILW